MAISSLLVWLGKTELTNSSCWRKKDEQQRTDISAQTIDSLANLGSEAGWDLGLYPGLPKRRWRRVLALWGFTTIPFYRAFRAPGQ
jgi:hypothetical protein